MVSEPGNLLRGEGFLPRKNGKVERPVISSTDSSSNPTKNPAIQITVHRFNGDNFLRWARSIRYFVSGRGKIGPLDCTWKP